MPADRDYSVQFLTAGETGQIWPAHPMTAHWRIEDPARVTGTPVQQSAAFVAAFKYLRYRSTALVNFCRSPASNVRQVGSKLQGIAAIDGSTGTYPVGRLKPRLAARRLSA